MSLIDSIPSVSAYHKGGSLDFECRVHVRRRTLGNKLNTLGRDGLPQSTFTHLEEVGCCLQVSSLELVRLSQDLFPLAGSRNLLLEIDCQGA